MIPSLPHRSAWAALAVLFSLCVGCERDRSSGLEPGAVSVRDSAGVVVVEHGPLLVEDSTSWIADVDREIRFGREHGEPDELFGRLAGFVRLSDGRVLVGDGMGDRLRMFAPDGRFTETVGRPGEGPGEFANLVGVRSFRGDSVVVVDFEGGRWSILGPDGRFVRHQYPAVRGWDRPGSSPSLYGFFEDGTALLGIGSRSPWETTEIAVDGGNPVRLETLAFDFVRTDSEGEILGRFGEHNLSRSVRLTVDGRALSWDGLRSQGIRAVRGERVWFADPEHGEIRVYRDDGTLERIVRVRLPEAAASPADVIQARLEASRRSPGDEPDRAFERVMRATPLPDRLPAFGGLAVDPSGYLWIHPHSTGPGEADGGVRWYVFNPEGVFVRALRLPSVFRAGRFFVSSAPPTLVLGDDWILARHVGPLGVETVRMVPLLKD